MENQTNRLSPDVQTVIEDMLPIIRRMAAGRGKYAISISGSQGKGLADSHSDLDFRLFHEEDLPWPDKAPELWKEFFIAEARWGREGVRIDSVWPRKISQVDADIRQWINGEGKTMDLVWTIWGYHLLPDIYHQAIIEDPDGVIADWKQLLSIYPTSLKKAVLKKHLESVRYWRNDYHYQNKIQRGDVVFTAGLTSRLVHDVIQILFALNETYYVGDGANLIFLEKCKIVPPDFADKVKHILYPGEALDMLKNQQESLARLIDEVIVLAERVEKSL